MDTLLAERNQRSAFFIEEMMRSRLLGQEDDDDDSHHFERWRKFNLTCLICADLGSDLPTKRLFRHASPLFKNARNISSAGMEFKLNFVKFSLRRLA